MHKSETVTAIETDSNGTVWVGSRYGLWSYQEGRWRTFKSEEGVPRVPVLAIHQAKNGALRNEVNAFLKEEGVAISITPGYNGDGGTIFSTYGGSENPNDPIPSPIVAIAAYIGFVVLIVAAIVAIVQTCMGKRWELPLLGRWAKKIKL